MAGHAQARRRERKLSNESEADAIADAMDEPQREVLNTLRSAKVRTARTHGGQGSRSQPKKWGLVGDSAPGTGTQSKGE